MWTFTLPGEPTLSPVELTAGEAGLLYSLVAAALPHTEDEISPNHCPLCRSAIAIVATMRAIGEGDPDLKLAAAAKVVNETPAIELLTWIGNTLDDEPPTANRAARRAATRSRAPKAPVKKAPAKKTAKRST